MRPIPIRVVATCGLCKKEYGEEEFRQGAKAQVNGEATFYSRDCPCRPAPMANSLDAIEVDGVLCTTSDAMFLLAKKGVAA